MQAIDAVTDQPVLVCSYNLRRLMAPGAHEERAKVLAHILHAAMPACQGRLLAVFTVGA